MSAASDPNRVSVLTPPGRSAVAVVAAMGPASFNAVDACFQAANGRRLADQLRDRIVFGHWSSGEHREEVVLVRGEGDSLEIHCHGGVAASGRISTALVAAGCRLNSWSGWIENELDGPIAIEATRALAQATTRRAAAILLDQRNGALATAVYAIQAALDLGDMPTARQMLTTLIDCSAVGLHLTQPWQVAIAGRPNVGKSSLINALVGYQRAIVFDQPGTTRDVLAAETAVDGWPVRLTDAAGIRATADPLEAEGVSRAKGQLSRADLVLWVLDATAIGSLADAYAIAERELTEEAGEASIAVKPLTVLNKIDLAPSLGAEAHADVTAVSALTRAGIDTLLGEMARRLVPAAPRSGDAVPFTAWQVEALNRSLTAVDRGKLAAASDHLRRLGQSPT